jgi:ABC-type nitrate/sulfonate/bicarbonate transport system permease component
MRQIRIKKQAHLIEEEFSHTYTVLGFSMGICVGISVGLLLGMLTVGLSLGTELGIAIGYIVDSSRHQT